MHAIDRFRLANNYVCVALGTAMNLLLMWMIVRKTTAELRPYSRLLLQTVVVDLSLLATNLLYHPVILPHGGGQLIYGIGLLAFETQTLERRYLGLASFAVWLFFQALSTYSLPLQFYYRYTVLCNENIEGREVSVQSYIRRMLLSVACTGVVTLVIVGSATKSVILTFSASAANLTSLYTDYELRYRLFVITQPDPLDYAAILVGLFFTGSSYVLIGWYSVRTWLHLRRTQALLPNESVVRAVNRQLNAILAVLALGPMLISFVPNILCNLSLVIGGGGWSSSGGGQGSVVVDPQDFVTDFFVWQPIFNAFAALFCIKPYRWALIAALRLWCASLCHIFWRGNSAAAIVQSNAPDDAGVAPVYSTKLDPPL